MAQNATTTDPSKLAELRFDYAWKWFAFHADQRVKVFNYMLLVFGIFAAGVVNALDKDLPQGAVAGLCFAAAGLALIFTRLDARNRDLVWMGEDILFELEREVVFGQSATIKGHRDEKKNQDIPFGILSRQAQLPSHGLLHNAWVGKHRVLFPAIGYLIAVLFFSAGFWILCKKPSAAAEKPKNCIQCVQLQQAPTPVR